MIGMLVCVLIQLFGIWAMLGEPTGGSYRLGLGLLIAGSAWLIVVAIQRAADSVVRRTQQRAPEE
ncbi:MAG: hypothetical protein KDB73_16865 [Planctomycetes bacterium]|nr:hypothetical protein [Planctomycetota bacterium]